MYATARLNSCVSGCVDICIHACMHARTCVRVYIHAAEGIFVTTCAYSQQSGKTQHR